MATPYKAPKKEAHPWTFRSRAQRIAEARLLCKQMGLSRAQTKVITELVTRLYADLMRCEKRRTDYEAAVTALINGTTGYNSKYKERYDPGYTSIADRRKLGPRLGGKE